MILMRLMDPYMSTFDINEVNGPYIITCDIDEANGMVGHLTSYPSKSWPIETICISITRFSQIQYCMNFRF